MCFNWVMEVSSLNSVIFTAYDIVHYRLCLLVHLSCLLLFRFNYRATHYMAMNGYYNFLNWFDDRAWYPLGRIVGGTVGREYVKLYYERKQ